MLIDLASIEQTGLVPRRLNDAGENSRPQTKEGTLGRVDEDDIDTTLRLVSHSAESS